MEKILTEESAASAWARSAVFHRNAIAESLSRIGHKDISEELKTYPLMTYLLPGMEQLK